jgi:hypothetical protein
MMTLNRYLLVGKDHAPWLVTIAKMDFKLVVWTAFLFSSLINIGHGWQYKAVEDLVFYKTCYSETYMTINGFSLSDYPFANQSQAYFIFSIVYFCVNVGLFFILNTVIEVKIVRRMHKELAEKRERMAKLHTTRARLSITLLTPTTNMSQEDMEKKKKEDDTKKERRVIKMVVLNSILNIVLRAPDLLFWMENSSIWSFLFTNHVINEINRTIPGILAFIADIGYFTYILTFITNFFIFYNFNKNFKEEVLLYIKPKAKK